ncbi:MAG: hypothetical protein AAF399_19790 [Bacteroidota bacterium]
MKHVKLVPILLAWMIGGGIVWFFWGKHRVLGAELGTAYLGEDAGFTELVLYDNGICERRYGGIMGVSDRKYYGFSFDGNEIQLQTTDRISNLTNMEIILHGTEYTFSALSKDPFIRQ